ncbi:MAG: polymer-forming cytoskeletal protein [Lachnospiraceae bacterium]|nr:polymer-forming cytoskeletal protein [Lachnospiraceae bacterium]
MGFFKDLKTEDTENGAVKEADELFDIAEAAEDEFIEDVDDQIPDSYLDADSEEVTFEEEEDLSEAEEEAEPEPEAEPAKPAKGKDKGKAAAPAPSPADTSKETDVTQVTIITKGTTINGSIISDCSLDVMGTINGDIECLGKLTISGTVVGNSTASDIFVNTQRLEGNINSEGSVKIGLGTVVVGGIKAGSGVIAGAVKGDIEMTGPIVIDSTAIIKGNITAQAVQMNNGAVVEGFCSLSNTEVDIEGVFD